MISKIWKRTCPCCKDELIYSSHRSLWNSNKKNRLCKKCSGKLKPHQKQKDLVRQNKIIEVLKPKKFWRYNLTTGKFTNIIEKEQNV